METVYCFEDRTGLSSCGWAPALGCGATPDGTKAWYMLPGLWQDMEKAGYVTCEEAGLSIFDQRTAGNPRCQ